MYNATDLKDGIIGEIGFRQNPDPSGNKLIDLLDSASGLYYNDIHPMLTPENLIASIPDTSNYTWPTFSGAATYTKGEIVDDGGDLFIRVENGGTAGLTTDPLKWRAYESTTEFLREKAQQGIVMAIDDWIGSKAKFKTVRNLLSRQTMFPKGGDVDRVEQPTHKVGQRITPKRADGVLMKITEIAVQNTEAGDYTIKVFEKGIQAPIYTQIVTVAVGSQIKWQTVDWTFEGEKEYYVVYDSAANGGLPINSMYGTQWKGGKYFYVDSIEIESDLSTIFSETDLKFSQSTNWGLNYKASVVCDYTEFILEQKRLFKTLISIRVAMELLRHMAFNPGALVNRNQVNADRFKMQLLLAIDGGEQSTPGNNKSLSKKYENALKAIQFDYTGINKICLPCRKRGPNYTSVM